MSARNFVTDLTTAFDLAFVLQETFDLLGPHRDTAQRKEVLLQDDHGYEVQSVARRGDRVEEIASVDADYEKWWANEVPPTRRGVDAVPGRSPPPWRRSRGGDRAGPQGVGAE